MHQSLLQWWGSISLRTKITGVTVLMLTLGLLVSGIGTMAMLKPVLVSQLDAQLEAASQPRNLNICLASGSSTTDEVASDGGTCAYFVALYNADGDLIGYNWKNEPASTRPTVPRSLDLAAGRELSKHNFTLTSGDKQTVYRASATIVPLKSADQENGTVIVAAPTRQIDTVMSSYLAIFLGFGILVVTVGAGLTRMLVTTTFAPLREVERTAAEIADGDFSQRLAGATPNTEVGRLNRSLNTMLSRIDRAFRDRARTIEQMRRFVGDASHELRTPLVSLRGYAELYRMGALQSDDEVAQAMDRIEREAIRMGILVEDLLELARLDETKPLELGRVDLVPIARDAAMDVTASSPERTVTVLTPPPIPAVPSDDEMADEDAAVGSPAAPHPADASAPRTGPASSTLTGPIAFAGATLARLRGRRTRRGETGEIPKVHANVPPLPPDLIDPAVVMAEENKIRQVVTNLIGNALRYTDADVPLEISVQVDHRTDTAVLEIIDHGEGIPPQIREKIFQRFWRADTSRTRETGGSGLGLAIVSSIIAAHNGTVEAVETPGGGATFRITLPLADSPRAPQPAPPTADRSA